MRKIEVSTSELLELRSQGHSNKQIAEMLEISVATVAKYIGKQGWRTKNTEKPVVKKAPEIYVISQTISVNGFCFQLDVASNSVLISHPGEDVHLKLTAAEADKLRTALDVVRGLIVANGMEGESC